jgi:predicted AAA+ superfamily ATPase
MQRDIEKSIQQALSKKIVLLSGPRQVGKTTIARSMFSNQSYFNYDYEEHRLLLKKKEWPRTDTELLIFDELHKMKSWKSWLKGIYDVEGLQTPIFVTGSARLDTAKKVGDSLAGRYLQFRLLPFSLKEILAADPTQKAEKIYDDLLQFGGFPEPFLSKDPVFHGQWQATHLDIILRQDLLDTENVRDIPGIETLVEILSRRVGQISTYDSLAQDLGKSPITVKKWLQILENLYIVFPIRPYTKSVERSLKLPQKFFFYDISRVKNGEAAKLENIVAVTLLKECYRIQDCLGQRCTLHYLRTKEGREVDFFIDGPTHYIMIEAKLSDDQFSPDLKHFARFFPVEKLHMYQVVANLRQEKEVYQGPKMQQAIRWLSNFSIE